MGTDKPDEEEYDVIQQVGHLLRRCYQRHLAIFQETMPEHSVTSVQFVAMCALRDNGPSSQAELVKLTAIDQATIRGIIDRLRVRGFIQLSKDKIDARKVIISLTAEGTNVLEELIPKAKEISRLTMGDLNAAEQLALLVVLKKMIDM